MPILTSKQFLEKLKTHSSKEVAIGMKRYFKQNPDDVFIGVRMGEVFKLAKEFSEMELDEIEKLLDNNVHEARVGGVSILDYIARKKKTPPEKRKEIYDLYLRRHDRIDNWDLVDRAAIYVIGGYLADKDRSILYKLAKSKHLWERRTSIIATAYFMMKLKEVEDTFKIAEVLIDDKEDLIHKATGWMLRVAGDIDEKELFKFLDKHAATMPRTALRYSLEKVAKKDREHYMKLGKKP